MREILALGRIQSTIVFRQLSYADSDNKRAHGLTLIELIVATKILLPEGALDGAMEAGGKIQ